MEIKHKKIHFGSRYSLKKAVHELLLAKNMGVLAYGTFKGVNLYSDSITYESAKLLIAATDPERVEQNDNAYITSHGLKFHTKDCDAVNILVSGVPKLKENLTILTKKDALERGFASCELCES